MYAIVRLIDQGILSFYQSLFAVCAINAHRAGIMVVTSKVLGLALLSALSLAVPFDENSNNLQIRDADAYANAVAEAILNDDNLLEERDFFDAELEERDLFDGELEERDIFDSELEERDTEHHWVGARDVFEDDFESGLEVRWLHRDPGSRI